MVNARGKYRFMCDADLSMPIEEIKNFLPPCCNHDIVIGSREIDGSVRYNEPWLRNLTGRIFNFLVRLLILPKLRDTQCGFKLFKKDVALDIFSSQTIGGWSFDVEILFIAKLRGYSIKEVPISWHYYKNSKINTFEDSVHMINEIIQIYNNHKKGLYNKHNVQKKPKYENIPNERMIKK
jgi:dolichyl-phosphate beta-glucosyltransferase